VTLAPLAIAITAGAIAKTPVRFPHPMLTEILYAVPLDKEDELHGDANLDGRRDPIGDEFIELTNPHDRPIPLGGYALRDLKHTRGNRVEFVFPPFDLPPGATVVVFNGYQAGIAEPYGDERNLPAGTHPSFHDAAVFTLRSGSRYEGLANKGDGVLLIAPKGFVVEAVSWGDTKNFEPFRCDNHTHLEPIWRSSIARDASGAWVPHDVVSSEAYSPGDPTNGATLAHAPPTPQPPP